MSKAKSSGGSNSSPAASMRMSVSGLARSGAVAGVIKLSSAGLSFLMFVTFAIIMDGRQFGLYSATYAGASLVSFFASVGQQSTVLRFWPQYAEAGDLHSAHGMMARAILVAFAGVLATSLLIVVMGFAPYFGRSTPEWLPLCLSAALLSLALAWSEFASGAFRAKGALVWGLLPRDVIWRAATIGLVLALHLEHKQIGAVTATIVTAGVLIVSVLPQTFVLVRDTWSERRPPLSPAQKAEFTKVTVGLWGATSLPAALGQAGTLLVAGILGPEIAGAVFVADRTTRLVLLALTGINQALAPEISGAFFSGDRNHVQKMTAMTALGSGAAALVILLSFVVLGQWILAIFDPAYATPTMHAVLVIFGMGATIASACGPVDLLMQLTGLQHYLMRLLIGVNIVGLALTALLTWQFGALGVAFGMAGTSATACLLGTMICRRKLDIDPSILGLFRGRLQRRPDPVARGAS